MHRSGLTAIAAVLALSSTPALAQAVPPTTTEAPASTAPPADTSTTTPTDPVATSTTAPTATPTSTATAHRSATTHRTATTTHHAAAAATAPVRRAPVRAAAPAPPPAAAAPAAPVAAPPVAAAPPPAAAAPQPAQRPSSLNPMLAIAGAVLALLALAAVALMLRRRRRIREEEELAASDWNDPLYEAPAEPAVAEPAPEPMVAAAEPQHDEPRSAFAWSAAPAAAATSAAELPEGVEAEPGSHVEAAYIGPTADNPSLSLKKRLKRAAFFDQREQMAAAGEAVPVETDAGLPETVADGDGDAAMNEKDREVA